MVDCLNVLHGPSARKISLGGAHGTLQSASRPRGPVPPEIAVRNLAGLSEDLSIPPETTDVAIVLTCRAPRASLPGIGRLIEMDIAYQSARLEQLKIPVSSFGRDGQG